MDSFSGIPIQASPALTGFNRAVRFGNGPICVSPAMYDLIRHADEQGLRTLLENIHVQQLPDVLQATSTWVWRDET